MNKLTSTLQFVANLLLEESVDKIEKIAPIDKPLKTKYFCKNVSIINIFENNFLK